MLAKSSPPLGRLLGQHALSPCALDVLSWVQVEFQQKDLWERYHAGDEDTLQLEVRRYYGLTTSI